MTRSDSIRAGRSSMTERTSDECMKAAWQAILRGDYAERDRLCERAKSLIEAEQTASAIQRMLAVDYYVTASGTAVPTARMAKAAGVLH